MSLRRIKRSTSGTLTKRSRSDFLITTEKIQHVESGYEEMDCDVSKNDIAADLRSIGNKYDKLVLKMFNQRSHLRGDLMLLKKDAKLLRNELKYLIVKHDNSTAFKKGYASESHEKERVLKAEIVTKEMGQLELALADLMSKYYFLLQQTSTLKEINSLWHIRSVLKSDFLQLKAEKAGKKITSIPDGIVKKNTKEVKDENANLTQKLRWLTKLGHEFRDELCELKAARAALVNGRSYLGREYNNNSLVDVTQESIPSTMDLDSISRDVRQAEVRIIDSLQERIDALDRLSDAFKLVMIKGGFASAQDLHRVEVGSATPIYAPPSREVHEIASSVATNVDPDKGLHSSRHSPTESEEDPEQVQVRYIRQEDIEDTDLRCLSSGERKPHGQENAERKSLYGGLNKRVRPRVAQKSFESKQKLRGVVKTYSSGYESIRTEQVSQYSLHAASADSEEFFDANESFTSAVTVWLRPEACVLSRTASEETLTEEINNTKECEERICNEIEMKFEEDEDEKGVLNEQSLLSRFSSAMAENASQRHSLFCGSSSSEEESEERDGRNDAFATDDKNPHERFFMAKSFFEVQCDMKDGSHLVCNDKPMEPDVKTSKIDFIGSKAIRNVAESVKSTATETVFKEQPKQEKETIPAAAHSATRTEKISNPDDRPVFYDPDGVWKGVAKKPSNLEKKLYQSNTLERKPKQRVSDKSSVDSESRGARASINNGFKTLPRGFKSSRKADDKPAAGAVVQRRSSATKSTFSDACSSLPRKQGTLKSQRPVSQIQRTSPEPAANAQKESPMQKLQSRPIARPVSQVVSSRTPFGPKSNLPAPESGGRLRSKTSSSLNRPVSRTGSIRQRESDATATVTPRRPASRGSFRQETTPDNSRPASRTGTAKQGPVFIYGTLPRMRKGTKAVTSPSANDKTKSLLPGQNASKKDSAEEGSSATSAVISSISSGAMRLDKAATSSTNQSEPGKPRHTVVRPCKSSEELQMIPQMQEDIQLERSSNGMSSNQGTLCSTLPRSRRNKDAYKDDLGVSGGKLKEGSDTLKKRKTLSLITKRQKTTEQTSCAHQEPNEKSSKTESEKKSKRKVSEKAAIFMHNALRFVSSDSKSKAKHNNNTINNHSTDTGIKRRPQSVGSYREHRKSFIPLPSFS